jgi:Acetyltransferase (GNAT) family
MLTATYADKNKVIDILSKSFENNQSVNYIVQQDSKIKERIEFLMSYSFDICYAFGKVFISNDKNACALILFPDKKKTSFKSILLDIQLILKTIGIPNIGKALSREAKIKKLQPKFDMYYLWFVGVDPASQKHGHGSKLLEEIIADSKQMDRPLYLETSTLQNLPWYQKFGFKIYDQLDLGYKLFFLKRDSQ